MAVQQNSYAIGNGVVPTTTNLDAIGDAVTFGAVTGAAPTFTAINVTGHAGQMLKVVANAVDSQSHYFAGNSLTGAARLKFLVDAAGGRVPGTTAYTLLRARNAIATGNANVFKAVLTLDLKCYLYSGDGTVLFGRLNNDVALADGLYYVEVLWSVNAATAASGAFSARLLNSAGAVVGNTISGIAANLGTAPVTIVAWAKPEAVSSVTPNGIVVGMPAADFGATAFIGAPAVNTAPVVSMPASQTTAGGVGFAVTATATDDGTIASYAWSVVSASSTATPTLTTVPNSPQTVTGTTPAAGNIFVLQCVVTDDTGLSTTARCTVRVPLDGAATARPLALAGSGTGTWTNVGGVATDGGALADESDTTYLESPSLTTTETNHRQRWAPTAARASNSDKLRLWTDTGTATATVRVYEGSTLRQSWTQALTTTPTEYTFALSAATIATIADFSNLYIEVAG